MQFPWHPSPLCRIKVEISHDDPVLLPPIARPLIHGYEREKLIPLLKQKRAHRKVALHGESDFFTDELRSEARTHWDSALGTFVADLPPFEKVIDDLRTLLSKIIKKPTAA